MIQADLFGREVRVLVTLQVSPDDPELDVPKRRAEAAARDVIDSAMTYSAMEEGIEVNDLQVSYVDSEVQRGDPYRKEHATKEVQVSRGRSTERRRSGTKVEVEITSDPPPYLQIANDERRMKNMWQMFFFMQMFVVLFVTYWMVF